MNIQTNPSYTPSPEIKALAKSLPSMNNLDLDIHWFVRPDSPNVLRISSEYHEDDCFIIDYYSTGHGILIEGDKVRTLQIYEPGPYIHPLLMEWAADHDGFWEWENPSNIAFYRF